ncbi:uncharacterized protein LOC143921505 [Arctopsyche grandis]|uniref:uncharacterized protein LOC143921505 n=1 Tax=Arctopsyche grandis TaxID=121162 RepID=UPI00406D851C
MDLKHELVYRPGPTELLMGAVKTEPELAASTSGAAAANGHAPSAALPPAAAPAPAPPYTAAPTAAKRPRTDDWLTASPAPSTAPLTPSPGPPTHTYTHHSNGYSSPMSSGSYDPYSPNGKNGKSISSM